jgi:hypothetical protein
LRGLSNVVKLPGRSRNHIPPASRRLGSFDMINSAINSRFLTCKSPTRFAAKVSSHSPRPASRSNPP